MALASMLSVIHTTVILCVHQFHPLTSSSSNPFSSSYSRVAYCDVTGRESRLPLKIRGEGIGPQLQLSFDTLDVQNVFVNSSHAYEVGLWTHTVSCNPPRSQPPNLYCMQCDPYLPCIT